MGYRSVPEWGGGQLPGSPGRGSPAGGSAGRGGTGQGALPPGQGGARGAGRVIGEGAETVLPAVLLPAPESHRGGMAKAQGFLDAASVLRLLGRAKAVRLKRLELAGGQRGLLSAWGHLHRGEPKDARFRRCKPRVEVVVNLRKPGSRSNSPGTEVCGSTKKAGAKAPASAYAGLRLR